MCPVFRAAPSEAAAPRGKANAIRELLAGNGEASQLSSGAMREVADRCVHCKMCVLECPAHVNVDKLMLEAKAANVSQHGLERGDWFFARLEKVLRWGSFFSYLANFTLRNGAMRWLLEKSFGLSARRTLPRLARRSFWSVARRRGWTVRNPARRPTVVYFPDLYATYVDPTLGEATGLVLEHNGFDVFVPAGLRSSGIEALVAGDVASAREMAQANLRALADLAREGLPIVCSEPSSALMLGQDYRDLIDELDSQLVARQAVEITQFLGKPCRPGASGNGFWSQSSPGDRASCALSHQGPERRDSWPKPSQQIPGLKVHTLDVGCSGMAGTYGLKAKNLQTSLAAGRSMLEGVRRKSGGCRLVRVLQLPAANGEWGGETGSASRAVSGAGLWLMPRLKERLDQPVKGKLLS